MDFAQTLVRTDEQVLLAETLRRFAAAEGDFEARGRRLRASPPARLGLWAALAGLGAIAALIPEAWGGLGGAPEDMAVVQAALAPALMVEPLLTSGVLCARILQQGDATLTGLLESVIAGERILALAHGEGFDPFAPPRMACARDGDRYILDGVKPAVRHADVATDLVVGAWLEGRVALFLAPVATGGVSLRPMRLIDGAGAADVAFEAVTLPAGARLPIADAAGAVTGALEWGLAGLAVETAALISAVNAATFAYLNVREQFGAKLASFQALRHAAANMAINAEEAAAMATLAIARLSDPPGAARSAALLRASLACDAAGRTASHAAIQLFGGMGVSDELIISHHARRLTALRAQIGTPDARSARLALIEGYG